MKKLFTRITLCIAILSMSFQAAPAVAAPRSGQEVARSEAGAAIAPQPDPTAKAEQSKTGPIPPIEVIQRDLQKQAAGMQAIQSQNVLSVPAYSWRHGCGPTAVGMVVAYYDGLGYGDLVPGDASTQTNAVNQMIASGGTRWVPNPAGMEGHLEDYGLPIDEYPQLKQDAYLSAGRPAHADNSLADFMDTSRSTRNNRYGWSWSSDVGVAFEDYVRQQNLAYQPTFREYSKWGTRMTWDVLTTEINAGRPLVFLVDSSGDGETDHFVTVVGYRDTPTQQYGVWDTWDPEDIRWENFAQMAAGVDWGVWGGWTFQLQSFSFDCSLVSDVPLAECTALETLYNSTNGAAWTNHSNWLSSSTVGNWYGVGVSAGHVRQVNLPANNLSGSLPAALGGLLYLESLSLRSNNLLGPIPPEMGSLSALKSLDLAFNQLSGSIPSGLGGLADLWLLDLSANQLSGSIPAELGSLSELEDLYLESNQLRGDLPAALADLSSLFFLNVRSNHLNVPAPEPPRSFVEALDPDWHLTQTPLYIVTLPLVMR